MRFGTIRLVIVLGVLLFGAASRTFHFGDHANDGKILFGTSLSQSNDIQGAQASFGPRDSFAWRAYLTDSVSATTLTRTISEVEPNNVEQTVDNGQVQVSGTNVGFVYGSAAVSDLTAAGIHAPGTFIMRYYNGSTLLAQGTFALTQ